MTEGLRAKKTVEAARERGLPAPEGCLPPVVISDHQGRLLDAFWELSSSRQIHMAGAGPIPWDVADAYAQRHEYAADDDLYEDFMAVVRGLDTEFLLIQGDEAKMNQAQAEARAKRAAGGRGRGR